MVTYSEQSRALARSVRVAEDSLDLVVGKQGAGQQAETVTKARGTDLHPSYPRRATGRVHGQRRDTSAGLSFPTAVC